MHSKQKVSVYPPTTVSEAVSPKGDEPITIFVDEKELEQPTAFKEHEVTGQTEACECVKISVKPLVTVAVEPPEVYGIFTGINELSVNEVEQSTVLGLPLITMLSRSFSTGDPPLA